MEITLLAGVIFIVVGMIMKVYPPKKINWFYGYRTNTSRRSQETWDEGNSYSAKTMVVAGIVLAIIGFVFLLIPGITGTDIIIGVAFVLLSALAMIVLTEVHLNKLFDKEGKRKDI